MSKKKSENLGKILAENRWCYFIPPQEENEKGFIPACVIEGQRGYRMMSGDGKHSVPWYWGNTEELANFVCDDFNLKLGISKADKMQIVLSTMPGNFK